MKKKLMLLGGNRYQLPVIKAAHELGCHVITCDYLPENIAHNYSDEYYNVSIIEKEAVLEVAKKAKIDGIMSFACDPGVVSAAYVAEELDLPSVGSYDSVCILQNKGKFRSFLKENGFNVPWSKHYNNKEDSLKEIETYRWPVMVKPTDSAGSKGVTRVNNPKNLSIAIDKALSASLNGEFIIEEYLEKVGCSSDTDCFSVDGALKFVSFNAQRFDKNAANPYAPDAYSWPATISEKNIEELTTELQRLIKLLNLKSSIYNIETRECTDGKAYIMECSPRGGGNRLAEVLCYATGVDMIKAAVLASLGETITGIEQRPYRGHWGEIVLHGNEPGVYNDIWISERIKDKVFKRDLWVKKGERITPFRASNDAIGTIVLRFDDKDELKKVIENTKDYVRVIVERD